MSVRIFKLAQELEMSSKDLMVFLRTQGHNVSSHMSNIEETVAQILRDRLKPKLQKEKALKEKALREKALLEKAAAEKLAPKPLAAGSLSSGSGPGGATLQRDGSTIVTERQAAERQKPGAERGGRLSPTAAGPKQAQWAEGDPDWSEAKEKEKEKVKEKEVGKEKEAPTRKRYFPSREDLYDSGPRFGGGRRKLVGKPKPRKENKEEAAVAITERPEKIEVSLPITVKDLSATMGIKAQAIIKALMQHGQLVHINQFMNEDMVTTVGIEFNTDVSFKKRTEDLEEAVKKIEKFPSKSEDLLPRAPVVTFMGHVDHGKTSLLDKIRQTSVTTKEAGGITQHLGAYRVDKGNIHVVFIDTPGHQAFTEMRARGAHVTDVVVLVVAADDGVMPQTEEALNHARAANVPIVVALNKIDKPAANVMRAKQQLSALGLQPVEWGGDTEVVEVSAWTSQGIETLLETLSLTSEILELKADPTRPAYGVVLEAEASTGRGVVVTLLVREGTLHLGDYVLCGPAHGRVRGMWLNGITTVEEAGPSTPVKVTGLNIVPEAGEKLYVFEDVQQARNLADSTLRKKRELDRADRQQITLENLFSTIKKGTVPEVRLILKADVRGSIEALRNSLETLSTEEVKIKILHSGVGAINQDDVGLAHASSAIVIGFNVTADERARELAEEKKVDIRLYQVIYKVIDDIRAAMQSRLAPQTQEEVHGHAEIRQVFRASKVGNIAGCLVTDGLIGRSDQVRLVREGKIVYTGVLTSLKRFKDDAREVKEGFECGMKIANYDDIKAGDVVEAFAVVEKPRQL